jgi:hypothetical protein
VPPTRSGRLIPCKFLNRWLHPHQPASVFLQATPLSLYAGATARHHCQGSMQMSLRTVSRPPDGTDQLPFPDTSAAEAAGDSVAKRPQGSYDEDGSVPDEAGVESDSGFQLLRPGAMGVMRTPVRHPDPHVRVTLEALSRMEQEAAAHPEEVSRCSPQKGQKREAPSLLASPEMMSRTHLKSLQAMRKQAR